MDFNSIHIKNIPTSWDWWVGNILSIKRTLDCVSGELDSSPTLPEMYSCCWGIHISLPNRFSICKIRLLAWINHLGGYSQNIWFKVTNPDTLKVNHFQLAVNHKYLRNFWVVIRKRMIKTLYSGSVINIL